MRCWRDLQQSKNEGKHLDKVNGKGWWPRRLAEAILGEKIVKDSTYTYHILHFTCPHPLISSPQNSFFSFIEGTEASSAEGLFRMESAEFSTSLLPLTPFHPEPGISKTPKVLTLFSHGLSLTIVGADSRGVCMTFSKPFSWFKQKAKEVKEPVQCTEHRVRFSPKTRARKQAIIIWGNCGCN